MRSGDHLTSSEEEQYSFKKNYIYCVKNLVQCQCQHTYYHISWNMQHAVESKFCQTFHRDSGFLMGPNNSTVIRTSPILKGSWLYTVWQILLIKKWKSWKCDIKCVDIDIKLHFRQNKCNNFFYLSQCTSMGYDKVSDGVMIWVPQRPIIKIAFWGQQLKCWPFYIQFSY